MLILRPGTGKQPGEGLFYKVTTDEPYGIGIRDEPCVESGRTGEDLIRGTIFEVDEIVEIEDGPTFLHLADQRGWVFDTSPIDPEQPSCKKLRDIEPGCTLTSQRIHILSSKSKSSVLPMFSVLRMSLHCFAGT